MAADLAGAIFTLLQADGTLTALATGGGYQIDKLGAGYADKHPINPEDTPAAYATSANVSRLQPCYTVATQSRTTPGLKQLQVVVEIRCYERSGYVNTRAMLDRIYVLLMGANGEGTYLTAGGKQYKVEHSTDLTSLYDDSIPAGQGKRGASVEAATYAGLGGTP